jgi:hypothetical protein
MINLNISMALAEFDMKMVVAFLGNRRNLGFFEILQLSEITEKNRL